MTQKPLEPTTPTPEQSPLVTALMGVTDGVQNLVRSHLTLARYEAKADAISLGKDVGAIVVALVFVLLGYLLLNIAAILFAAWYGGIIGMAIVAMSLALIHLLGGAWILKAVVDQFKARHYGLQYTGEELERSKTWAKQIPEKI